MPANKETNIDTHRNTFPASERLKRKKQIDQLFRKGSSITEFPLQAIFFFETNSNEKGTKVAFSVPKKIIKLAVNRNRVKRLMRESYRKNKHDLFANLNNTQGCMHVMFIYKSKEIIKYKDIEQKIFIILQRLQNNFK